MSVCVPCMDRKRREVDDLLRASMSADEHDRWMSDPHPEFGGLTVDQMQAAGRMAKVLKVARAA